jgi:hypothetical protein
MRLDVRLPIGLLFTAVGVVLSVYGLVSDPAIYQKSLGINVNLRWGAVLLVFGVIMLALGWRSRLVSEASVEQQRQQTVAR